MKLLCQSVTFVSESKPSSPSGMARTPPVRQMSSVRRRWPRSSAQHARMTSTATPRAEWTRPLRSPSPSSLETRPPRALLRVLTPASSRAFPAAPLLTKLHPKLRHEPLYNLHCGGINPYTLTAILGPGGLAHYETSSRFDLTARSFAQGNKTWRSSRILVG